MGEIITFDSWFNEIHQSKSSGLLLLFNRLLREFEVDFVFQPDFQGDVPFVISESLKLPDLCGHVLWPKARVGNRFRDWLRIYVEPYGLPIDGKTLWKVRNGFVHSMVVPNEYGFDNAVFGAFKNDEQHYRNLLNVCMQISRTACGFYLENYGLFEKFGEDFSANWRVYKNDAGLEKVMDFARRFFLCNPDLVGKMGENNGKG